MYTHVGQCCSVVVGGVKDHVDSDNDDEDEEMVLEEGVKAFGNDWLPPKKTAEYVTDHFGLISCLVCKLFDQIFVGVLEVFLSPRCQSRASSRSPYGVVPC